MTKKTINLVKNLTTGNLVQNNARVGIATDKHNGKFTIAEFERQSSSSDNSSRSSSSSKSNDSPSVSYLQLFRYATILERVLIIFGLILCSIGALGIPISTITYGEFTSLLIDRTVRVGTSTKTIVLEWFGGGQILTNASIEENQAALIKDSEAFAISSAVLFVIQFFMVVIGVDIINRTSLQQINRIRILFFKSLLRQDMTWYDTVHANNFASKMTENLEKIKEAISEKVGIFFFLVMSFITSIIFSFFYGWKLTLVVMSCAPFIILSVAVVTKIEASLAEKELKSYSIAGSVAEEVLSGIRTVVAFSGEKNELKRYSERLKPAEENGNRKGLYSGLGGGFMWFIIYCCYALALWYGVKLILDDRDKIDREYTPAVLVIVLFGVLVGAENLGFTSPHIEAFSSGRGAATGIYSIIDRKPQIDSMDENGLKPDTVTGNIQFENVTFQYPARSNVSVLNGISFTIQPGQTVALVGSSGCGKSTCLQLMQRLYDPMSGIIKLDGVNIVELNTAWLRSKIGVVGQEPILFATTIGENIRYGKPTATQEEIEEAAKLANCHSFIKKLPQGYDTMVGERGAQMSGGQKQRIAIARALIRNPPILLLDEATSALDPTSERHVQDALEEASKGRTTLVVSHRLSSITNSDKILYIENGVVVEEGTHNELMEKQGQYYSLVNTSIKRETVEVKNPRKIRKRPIARALSEADPASEMSSSTESIDEIAKKKDKFNVSMLTLLKLNAPEWKFILVGVLASVLNGASLPIFSILFGEFYGILSLDNKHEVSEQSKIFSYYFIGLGIIAGLGTLLQTYMFNLAGSRLTSRLRQLSFKSMLSQEMAWFDDEKNSIGALCTRLSGDCAKVQGATGSRIGVIVQSISTLVVGTLISFYYSWNLTLVTLITVPIVLISVYLESRYIDYSDIDEKQAIESSAKIAVEAISNIRTVASLGQEKYVLERYCKEIEKCTMAARKKIRFRGCVFSLGQTVPTMAYGIGLYYGGYLVATTDLEYKNVIKITEALIFGAWTLGAALAYAPNINAATTSAGRILKLLKRVPKIHNPPNLPYNTTDKIDGDISYENVEFRYPKRQEVPVLQGLNLDIEKSTTVALVGPSGCGKSTCIQLLLRYYDPDDGKINLTGTPTTEFPFEMLRSQLGLVSQEPVLFDKTIAENIAYGDNFREVPAHEIIEAAKKANIHDFITALPSGYETQLGAKGAQLSGGQKQRIAIARALVRNPRILILDEATSALDMQSEKIVQEALDAARSGRTCITIAHRLTTVQNADVICVIKNGVIAEKGTHEELMDLNGIYANLYEMQQIH